MSKPPDNPWKNALFLRLVIPLAAGIMGAWYFPSNREIRPAFILYSFVILALLFILIVNIKPLNRNYKTIVLYIFIFLLGALLAIRRDVSRRNDFAGKQLAGSSKILLALREPLVEKPASWKAGADIIRVEDGKIFHPTTGRAILYFQKTDSLLPLHYGDVILASNHLEPIQNSGNPGAFNYKRYCRLQNIYYQAYLPSGTWKKLSFTSINPLQSFFIFCRSWCLRTLSKYITGEKELGVAEALLVGYRDNLNKALVQAYAHVGVVHIIAISGLHLGLIYLILLLLLKPLPDKGRSRWLKGILIILSLWCFAIMTGAASSALRAAVMFSFLAAGRFFFRRKANTLNTLAASAFLLLCYNPFLLLAVGFQLSYLAVLGILIFQKPVFNLFISRSKIWNYFWKMMSLSIAAELLTFPLALYYFHRFPALFLVGNLVVIPLASCILYGEIILLMISVAKPVAVVAGIIITKAISAMDSIIMWINGISFSSLQAGVLTPPEVILIYMFIAAITFWLFYKNKKAFIFSLSLLLCFSTIVMFNFIRVCRQKKIIVYDIPHHTAVDLVNGTSACFVGDTGIDKDASILQYDLTPARIALHITERGRVRHGIHVKNFIRFFNIRLVVLDSTLSSCLKSPLSFPVNYVLVSHNPTLNLPLLRHIFSPQLIIFDASNSWWKIEKWKTVCKQLNLPCFSVPEQGAWELDLR